MKNLLLFLIFTITNLIFTDAFATEAPSRIQEWLREIGPKRFFGEFPIDKLCPRIVTREQFEHFFESDEVLLEAPLVHFSGFPFVGFHYRGDLQIIHYEKNRFPLHHFELRILSNDQQTLTVFEQGEVLSFKCYFDAILKKEDKEVKGREEYEQPYHLVLHGEIIDKEAFMKNLV